jgi:hypothetical protein
MNAGIEGMRMKRKVGGGWLEVRLMVRFICDLKSNLE